MYKHTSIVRTLPPTPVPMGLIFKGVAEHLQCLLASAESVGAQHLWKSALSPSLSTREAYHRNTRERRTREAMSLTGVESSGLQSGTEGYRMTVTMQPGLFSPGSAREGESYLQACNPYTLLLRSSVRFPTDPS